MRRESINPWDRGLKWSMDQGEIVEGARRHLHCSGQVAVKPDPGSELGIAVVFPGEMRGQIECALANYDVYASWIAEAGTRPPQSLLGINRLFLPELTVEIEAIAAE